MNHIFIATPLIVGTALLAGSLSALAESGIPGSRNCSPEIQRNSGLAGVGANDDLGGAVGEESLPGILQRLAGWEYQASENGQGLQAPNRAHDLRIYFDARGILVQDRLSSANSLLAGLSLRGWGRESAMTELEEGTISSQGARVEIERGEISEWYLNTPLGLEQGFDVSCRAAGEGALVLELSIAQARAARDGDSVLLTTDSGRKLRYGKLVTQDAEGRVLESHFSVPSQDRVQLVIDDAQAIYPIVIDPLLTGAADFLLQSNQPDPAGLLPAAFGANIASAGDVNGDGFDDIIVGAPGWDGGDPHEGAAFVFLGSAAGIVGTGPAGASGWIESNQAFAQLGTVAGAGDVNGDGFDDIIVGAHFYDDVLVSNPTLGVTGAAFVFLGSASGIVGTDPSNAHAWITANQFSSNLGGSVSGAGDINGDGFDDILVGASAQGLPFPPPIPENQGSGDYGAVLVFHGSAAGITGTGFPDADAVLTPFTVDAPTSALMGGMGQSIDSAGDVNGDGFADIIVGPDAMVFLGSAGGIVGTDPTTANAWIVSDQPGSALGSSVAGAGDINGDGFSDILVGAPFYPVQNTTTQEGAAFVFLGSAAGISAASPVDAHASFFGNQLASWVGMKVAGAGDTDGDGFDDILIGVRAFAGSLDSEGGAYLFRGSAAGIGGTTLGVDEAVRLEPQQSQAVVLGNHIAFGLAGAGDINGDGLSDVMLGAGYYDVDLVNEGAVFLYEGNPWPLNPNLFPLPDAGVDLVFTDVDDNWIETVTLDGRSSYDPDGTILSYEWLEGETLLGTAPILTMDVSVVGSTHAFALNVTDNDGVTRGDIVKVRINLVDSQQSFFEPFVNGFASWTIAGNVALDQTPGFPDPPHALLSQSPATLSRTVTLPPGTTGMSVPTYKGKAMQFGPTDQVLFQVSVDGGPFTTIHTITSADSNGVWNTYGGSLNLGHSWYPATASTMEIRFESFLTTGQFFVDDVVVNVLMGPANPDADGDGTPDALDGCPLNPNKIAPGVCGCGVPDVDANGNGTMDCLEVACVGDIMPPGLPAGNGVVNIDDLVAVLNAFGVCAGCPEDITPAAGNGVVNIDDLVAVLNAFGLCP